MKILVIGFLAFFGWSALSTHLYVCQIKGLCNEPTVMQTIDKAIVMGDTSKKTLIPVEAVLPATLSIYFAFDKSEFNSDAATDKYIEKSNAYLNQNSQAILSITGYTDAIGSDEYNQALGYRRALSPQEVYENKGMHGDKIIIESKGEKEPASDNNSSIGRANNRRAVITIK
jgi:Outer membrane protein and related peptidoglycan-associated (lipo)proteins